MEAQGARGDAGELVRLMPLGDLLRAIAALEPQDGETRARIAELLGIPAAPAAPALAAPALAAPEAPSADEGAAKPPGVRPVVRSDAKRSVETRPEPSRDRLDVEIIAVAPPRPPSGTLVGRPIASPLEPGRAAALYLPPLFRPEWIRALIATAVARPEAQGPIDIERVVDHVARLRPMTALFRRRTPTVARGVQVLVDVSDGMAPFGRDAREMTEAVRLVVGLDGTDVCYFEGSPLLVADESAPTELRDYRPPREGATVLAMSDLGIAPALSTDTDVTGAWLELADVLLRNRSALVVLVPYPEQRWPAALAKRLTLLPWDRPTGVARVRRAIAAGSS
ncbi:hypothetical protein [Sorangium sp. So ce1153]|uniref:hypothetical protein n=1 Tax=Sorangium sp. So ce1153 TaxID=3133333 RepID=UPI003F61EB08